MIGLVALALIGQSSSCQSAVSDRASIGSRAVDVCVLDGVRTDLNLSRRFVVVGSESVFVDGEFSSDYLVDYARGCVVLLRRFPVWTPVVVTYLHAGFSDVSMSVSGAPFSRNLDPKGVEAATEEVPALMNDEAIAMSGVKSLGLSAGSAGLGIDQATSIRLAGKVGSVAVEANLSDQDEPIPPEGTTWDIEEIDRIAVSVQAPTLRANLGDVDMGIDAGGFGRVHRSGVGGKIVTEVGSGSRGGGTGAVVSGSYARPRGRHGRVMMTGDDGMQGPYLLAPDGRSAQIVPGSEEVYLDGRRMTRGWDQDYTIDYSTGELFFTNRHIINARSRIEAEFQFVTEAFERSMVTGNVEMNPGPCRIVMGVMREADDPNRSLGTELSNEERAYLRTIGGDTAKAWLPGAKFVGPGEGDYVLEVGHFRYVGPDLGEYDVNFTLVGDSLGDYVYDDSLLAFRYAGDGLGNYVDSVRVSLPQRDDVGYAQLGLQRGRVSLGAEAVFRRRNVNLFAADGAESDAGALGFSGLWRDSAVELGLRHVHQGTGFGLPGSQPTPDFSYRWAGSVEAQRRTMDEVRFKLEPWRWFGFTAEAGRLLRDDGQSVDRYSSGVRLSWLSASVNKVALRWNYDLVLAPAVRSWGGQFGRRVEVGAERSHKTWFGGIEFKPDLAGPAGIASAGLTGEITDYAETTAQDGQWQPTGRDYVLQTNLGLNVREALQARAMFGFGRLEKPTGSASERLFGSGRLHWTPISGTRVFADLAQTNRRVQLSDERFVYVGPGRGSYRRDSLTGRYVFDPEGDYRQILTATGRFTAARELQTNVSAEVFAFTPASLVLSFANSSTTTDSGTLTGSLRYDARVNVAAFAPHVTGSVGGVGEVSSDKTLAVSGRRTIRHGGFVELSSQSLVELEPRGRLELNMRRRMYSNTVVDYDELTWKTELIPVIGSRLRLELTLRLAVSTIAEPVAYPELGRFQLVAYELGAARTWSITERTRLRLGAGVVRRSANVAFLPFDVGLTQPLGVSPSATFEAEHVFSRILTLSVRYRFADRPDRAAEHTFSSELRAYF